MSNIPINDSAAAVRKVDTFQRVDGADTVEIQAVAVVDPVSGAPVDFATQATLEALNTIAAAVLTAIQSLNGKTTAINTGAVALDASTLAALETTTISGSVGVSGTVSVDNLPATQAVSGTFWPVTQPVSGTVTVNGTRSNLQTSTR